MIQRVSEYVNITSRLRGVWKALNLLTFLEKN